MEIAPGQQKTLPDFNVTEDLWGVRAVDGKNQALNQPALTLDDIKKFRQLESKTPGHPEYGLTAGVETTTGPLGQGVANSVGMAMAARWFAARYNRPGHDLFEHNVYALCGDGCLMEGISAEAASIAGHLQLSNLCWIYDSNRITIEGHTEWAFSEDVATRFIGYGWNVTRVGDANDLDMLRTAGLGVAFRAKPKVAAAAHARVWSVIEANRRDGITTELAGVDPNDRNVRALNLIEVASDLAEEGEQGATIGREIVLERGAVAHHHTF